LSAFLEQRIVRRELAVNFVRFNPSILLIAWSRGRSARSANTRTTGEPSSAAESN
jgi:hypothetical protein